MSKALKIYFLPFFAGGHVIPMVNLARLMASKGHQVTIITTPSNAKIFDKTIDDEDTCFHVHIIKFPSNQVGLPVGVENLLEAYDKQSVRKVMMAANLIQSEIEAFMKLNPPDIFIPDMVFTWSEATTKILRIPRLIFKPIPIFYFCMIKAYKSIDDPKEEALLLPNNTKLDPNYVKFYESVVNSANNCDGVIVNTFLELEVEYTQLYEKLIGYKAWLIGPTSLMVQKTIGTCMNNDEHECFSFLSSKEQNSVLYISFGSMSLLSDEQLFEIASGIEASGHQFLWVVHIKNKRTDDKTKEEEEEEELKWLPKGFEEKMMKEKRGLIIKGWAPQVSILNHSSIGGFLTQCGWNAALETIGAGVPVITMPIFSDHYFNEKFITEVQGFGVEVEEGGEWSLTPYDPKKKVVSRESVEKAVRKLMDGGEESMKIRSKAKELQEKAWKAVEEGGSSQNTLIALINHLHTLLPNPHNQ
ncbi:hypothetical protein TanjilG_31995 [Lupinus angustifolius]|uniref:Glycosyltransferase n=1 Tax=Lupinus angustifolius TaxID=3871 RepID=A0A1J7I4P1_LUPAN|nr:PREDICTED: UDP-glucose flavonoid 3-O-glucosyltransferase 7-like [Lupinus angustifolius]OIW07803.1 hypothetical protein TanjilG_31995 [Lupinus angustifolius]